MASVIPGASKEMSTVTIFRHFLLLYLCQIDQLMLKIVSIASFPMSGPVLYGPLF